MPSAAQNEDSSLVNNRSEPIGFTIVQATSQDISFPAENLHRKNWRHEGWVSQRFPDFPQRLILKLPYACSLKKLDLLIHHALIPQKIDIFAGSGVDVTNVEEVQWQHLGFVSLNDGQQRDTAARELKSVFMDVDACDFVRIDIDRPFPSKDNLFAQVAMCKVVCHGMRSRVQKRAGGGPKAKAKIQGPQTASAAEEAEQLLELSDEPTRAIINDLVKLKAEAIEREDYYSARDIKKAEMQIRAAAAKIVRLVTEKQLAIESEEFDRCTQLTEEINRLKKFIGDSAQGVGAFRKLQQTRAEYNARRERRERESGRRQYRWDEPANDRESLREFLGVEEAENRGNAAASTIQKHWRKKRGAPPSSKPTDGKKQVVVDASAQGKNDARNVNFERRAIRSPESPPTQSPRPKSASQTQFDDIGVTSESNLGRNLFVATPQSAKTAPSGDSKEPDDESARVFERSPEEERQLGASSSKGKSPEATAGKPRPGSPTFGDAMKSPGEVGDRAEYGRGGGKLTQPRTQERKLAGSVATESPAKQVRTQPPEMVPEMQLPKIPRTARTPPQGHRGGAKGRQTTLPATSEPPMAAVGGGGAMQLTPQRPAQPSTQRQRERPRSRQIPTKPRVPEEMVERPARTGGKDPWNGLENTRNLMSPPPLDGASRGGELAIISENFSEYILRSLLAARWKLRDAAMRSIRRDIEAAGGSIDKGMIEAAGKVIEIVSNDRIATMHEHGKALLLTVTGFTSDFNQRMARQHVKTFCRAQVSRLGDSNDRNSKLASECLDITCKTPWLGPGLVVPLLLESVAESTKKRSSWAPWRLVLGRLRYVGLLIQKYSLEKRGHLTDRDVVDLLIRFDAGMHPHEAVRQEAKKLCRGLLGFCSSTGAFFDLIAPYLDTLKENRRQELVNFIKEKYVI